MEDVKQFVQNLPRGKAGYKQDSLTIIDSTKQFNLSAEKYEARFWCGALLGSVFPWIIAYILELAGVPYASLCLALVLILYLMYAIIMHLLEVGIVY